MLGFFIICSFKKNVVILIFLTLYCHLLAASHNFFNASVSGNWTAYKKRQLLNKSGYIVSRFTLEKELIMTRLYFPGYPVPAFPGIPSFCISRFPGKMAGNPGQSYIANYILF
jgi:hypothetical protein